MEAGVESPDSGKMKGILMDFPATDGSISSSPPRMPPRLRRRLSETKASQSSVEEIEAKLRDADLRRQKFYENLSIKARPKPRSPSQSLSHDGNLGQRLEAKLQAAEQKRLSILSKAQMRLARLDELRQAAKNEVEKRFKKEKAELGTKVELRVQQAEINRMLILKAHRQRKASLRERTSQTLLRRMARESKYKECVRAAIHQKRVAAEKKRIGLLEAEKKRVHARVSQVQKVANSVSNQREIERRRMKDKLEERLQRAKRQRAEYLRQRGRPHTSVFVNLNQMHKQANLLSRKLARCWRRFQTLRRTTLELAKAYDALHINERSAKSMPFEQLAFLIESATTLQTTRALLDRLESRYKLSRTVAASSNPSNWDDINHLLKRVASPNRRTTPRKSIRSKHTKNPASMREAAKTPVELSRYQVRVVLCAYMILGHPDAVFSGQGEQEMALDKAAEKFVREYELLVKIMLNGPIRSTEKESDPAVLRRLTLRSQITAFDAAWCTYLNCFVVWKVKDARLLEEDLVRAACQLELSMIQKCKLTPEGDCGALTHDMMAIQKQVMEDQKLLREKVHHLSGDAGIERMEGALSDTRIKYFQARENGSPLGSPITHILAPIPTSFSSCSSAAANRGEGDNMIVDSEKPNVVVRSLFKDDASYPQKDFDYSSPSNSLFNYYGEKLEVDNELIVNEVVHGQQLTFADGLSVEDEEQNTIKAKVRVTMEEAFWNGIMDSVKVDKPNYDRVLDLMREVRDAITELAPQSWKQEIFGTIDLDILSQGLKSNVLDMEYLGKVLEFALITVQKLSAPANETELKVAHQKLLKELAETCQVRDDSSNVHDIALIRGLRFILEQIQVLKQEISKARIRLLEPLLKSPAGLDYLKKAFTSRYGPPSDALTSLSLTKSWLSSVADVKDQEWDEHAKAFSELMRKSKSSSQRFLPSTALRTGGSFSIKMSGTTSSGPTEGAHTVHPECKGEKVDLLVRLGLLKLVISISGVSQEELPETQKLNFRRLRSVQARLQKIIVMATSILVLQQTLVSEGGSATTAQMESMVSSCVKQLWALLNTDKDAGMKEIIDVLDKVAEGDDKLVDTAKLLSRKDVMARVLTKSLQAGDTIFVHVSRAVYLAARGVVLGGNGVNGRGLAEMALQRIGAAVLTDSLVEAAQVLIVAATVSTSVHGPWYTRLTENM